MTMERLIVVEDNKSISRNLKSLFETAGYSAVICSGFGCASSKVRQGAYFLAIVDMDIHDASWEETVEMVGKQGIPVIIYSSRIYTAELREELQKRRILDFISKNGKSGPAELLATVERLRLNSFIKVLLVDDSTSARTFGRSILEQAKFTVLEAGDGMEALGLIEREKDVSIVITDFEMPHMNGYELVQIIRTQYGKNSLSVIGVSHPSTAASSASFLKYGANDFIRKPYSPEEFYCRVITQAELLESFRHVTELNEQKNNIIGMVAHDIRVPLANIESVCLRLIEKSKDDMSAKVSKGLEAIWGTSGRMLHLLEDLLNITSLEKGKNVLDIKDNSLFLLVQERIDAVFAEKAAKKDISLILKKEKLRDIPFDRNRIAQVADNLISNALKFTPPGGEVIINLKEKNGRQVFRIWDNGPGLNQYDMEQAFREFQTLSAKPTGGESSTGLGLAICRKIINMHDGQIWVNSEQGMGAEFCFSLPARDFQ